MTSAMAGATVSEEGNNESIYNNPAGLTEINDFYLYAGNTKLYGFDFLSLYNLSSYLPMKNFGTIGIGLQQLETKHNEYTLSKEQTISLSHGLTIQKDNNSHLALGYTTNFIQWDLGRSSGITGDGSDGINIGSLNTITFDVGILASLRNKYRFGVLIKNFSSSAIGKNVNRFIITQKLKVGLTYKPTNTLSTNLCVENILGHENSQIQAAIKYNLNKLITIFTGIQSNPNRFGIGTSFTIWNNNSLSYGLLTHPVLPITHQFNIGFSI